MDEYEVSSPPDSGPAPEVPGYDVGRLLGCGGTAAVWLATDQSTRRDVALKCFSATVARGDFTGDPPRPGDAEDAVRREVRILSALDHEHLVKAHAVVRVRHATGADGLGLVLDYAPGGSLAELLAARGSLGPGEAVTVLTPIAQTLAYLHGHGFTHGDVSPGNVLFTAEGKPLLADLGVARMLADPQEPSRAGTDGFRDPAPVDAVRAGLQPEGDVYSAAALGWYMLTGRAPEPEQQRPPLPLLIPGVPPGLAEALEAGLRNDRRLRPSAAELAAIIFRSAPAAPVDLSVSVHPTVLPQLLTRRALPASARERRAARLRALGSRVRRRRRGAAASSRLRSGLAVSTRRAWAEPASGGPMRARHAFHPDRPRAVFQGPGFPWAGLRRAATALVLAVLLAVAGLFAASLLPGSGTAPPSAPPSAVPSAVPSAPAEAAAGAVPAELQELLAAPRPEDAVRGLAGLRSYALSTGRLGLLEQVTVPASPAAAADAEVRSRLAETGHVLDGFEARLSLVESLPESTAARAVVQLSVASPPYRERDGAGTVVAEAEAAAERRLRLVLVPVDGRWRIREILPGQGGVAG
ncbi:serine/threonine-protein kinase [Arthrobacter sp. UYEF3]|uniref:serine/threonine-protein kinase n=1 Tax=Arthrobacter sp. UYEF3 TaxID=1756365 RepID=UPI00339AC6D6